MTIDDAIAEIERLVKKPAEWALEMNIESERCWGVLLRVTPHPNTPGPDISYVLHCAGPAPGAFAAVGLPGEQAEVEYQLARIIEALRERYPSE